MGQPAPIPRRSSHLGSAACYGRSDHGSHSSTSAASSRSKRRQGNHNQFQTLKMFPDGHSHKAGWNLAVQGSGRFMELREDELEEEAVWVEAFEDPSICWDLHSDDLEAQSDDMIDALADLLVPDRK